MILFKQASHTRKIKHADPFQRETLLWQLCISLFLRSWLPEEIVQCYIAAFWKIVYTIKPPWLSAAQVLKREPNVVAIFPGFLLCRGCKNSHFPFFSDTMVEGSGWLDIYFKRSMFFWPTVILIISKCLLNRFRSEIGRWRSLIWRESVFQLPFLILVVHGLRSVFLKVKRHYCFSLKHQAPTKLYRKLVAKGGI